MTSELAPVLADRWAIASDLGLHPGTIRNWASAGKLTRRGKDARGRTLYDLDDVIALASGDTPRSTVAGVGTGMLPMTPGCSTTPMPGVQSTDTTAGTHAGVSR